MRVIDSADSTADAAVQLINGQLAAGSATSSSEPVEPGSPRTGLAPHGADIRCFATDSVEKFSRLGSRFLGQPVGQVQLIDLGG
jgi:glutamate racemase